MNEPASPRWTDPATLPPPTIYDPAEDGAPPFSTADSSAVILLLVGEVDRGWATRTAVELCAAWAGDDRRIVLADFHFENPVLQDELGGHGLEGVVDIFVYGASLARSTQRVAGRNIYFMPTGTYTPDVDAIFRHPRWSTLVASFRGTGSTLVIFAPADAADLGALAAWVDQLLLLGEPHDAAMLAPLHLSGAGIRGLIVPPRVESAPSPPLPTAVGEPHDPRPDVTTVEEQSLHLPPPPVRIQNRGHRAAVLLIWILLGAALITAVAYAIVSVRPDLVPWARVSQTEISSATAAPPLATSPRPLGEPLPFSVQVIAFQNFEAARDQLLKLRQEVPGVLFFISPEEIQGMLYFRILAGALPNIDLARQIKDVLVASGTLDPAEAAGEWTLIRENRFSFLLGDAATRAAANASVDSLLARRVSAYPVAVPYSDGALRWHLYAGAFADSLGAAALGRQLTEAGIEPRLTARFGSPASPEL